MKDLQRYISAIEILALGQAYMVEDEFDVHVFEWGTDGDGWNEPESDWFKCSCNNWEESWVQVDVKRTGRPQLHVMVLEWVEHIYKDVWKVYDEWEDNVTDYADGHTYDRT